MKRREFFRNAAFGAAASSFLFPAQGCSSSQLLVNGQGKGRTAKNIIFLVSDGMSTGTLNMAELLLRRKEGRGSHWLDLYRDQRAARALMDTASSSSLVTDSAASSSSWGGGHRVPNGHLNIGSNGEEYLPILQKFKRAGKKVGCVTTVPITHATPAGFCVNSKSRNSQPEIAIDYLKLRFDVMMGGGAKYFEGREDGRNLFAEYAEQGFQVSREKSTMLKADSGKPVLGIFDKDGLPYDIDRLHQPNLQEKVPSLAEMTTKAIDLMKSHTHGFVLQVEGGKVDWAAHSNDAPALLYDQIAFDEAIHIAINFAAKDQNTLVIITTDHGNSNPGLYYGSKADENFDKFLTIRRSNDSLLMGIKKEETPAQILEKIKEFQGIDITIEQSQNIKSKYLYLDGDGVYNAYKLPFKEYGQITADHTSVSFGGMDHTGDFVELAMFGPGSERLKPFVINTDLHQLMLDAAEVENKF
ncbi:MAG: alkaline phosphatase [Saprospiraceae bacterium]|jgi:alkaline phosphatase|nr:alkaline phosphatase [Saprospiraceae bacterium]